VKLLLIPLLLTQVIYSQCCSNISVTGSADLIYGNYKKLGFLMCCWVNAQRVLICFFLGVDDGALDRGFGGFGALGLGTFERILEPKQVELLSLDMQKMVHIAAGGAHTAAVSESGKTLNLKFFHFFFGDFLQHSCEIFHLQLKIKRNKISATLSTRIMKFASISLFLACWGSSLTHAWGGRGYFYMGKRCR
jgi:hypothetical protein